MAYPTRLEFADFFGHFRTVDLGLTGPVKGFTLQQDLEKRLCRVFGVEKSGFFELHVFREGNDLSLKWVRGKKKGEKVVLMGLTPSETSLKSYEKISLGSSKKQDVDLMWRRANMIEVLPILYALSQNVPLPSEEKLTHLPQTEEEFSHFVKGGFDSLFVPKRGDERHLGIFCEQIPDSCSPLHRLKEFKSAFRALFIKEEEGKVVLLPNLPKKFLSGRFLGVKVEGATIDVEWRKGTIHSVIISPDKEIELSIVWPKEIRSFRIEKREGLIPRESRIILKEEKKTVIDKFQK